MKAYRLKRQQFIYKEQPAERIKKNNWGYHSTQMEYISECQTLLYTVHLLRLFA